MRALLILASLTLAMQLVGCASHPDPIIDTKGVDPDAMALDMEECEVYAEKISIAEGTAKGAGLGAAVGAVVGAISGGHGDVADDAAIGAVYGGTGSGLEADRDKQAVFKRCMRGRGYRVLN
jgi:outer membrane lipoprotein SlyB